MKILTTLLLSFLLDGLSCNAQDSLQDLKETKLRYHAIVTTDSGIEKGYLWQTTDSSVFLSDKKKVLKRNAFSYTHSIPVENISVLTVKNTRFPFAEMAGGFIVGFVLTAGLWQNDDVDRNGNLSFWELLWGAVDGTTSGGRSKRQTALWVGVGGGVAGLVAGLLSQKKLTITLPIGNRLNSYHAKKYTIETFIR